MLISVLFPLRYRQTHWNSTNFSSSVNMYSDNLLHGTNQVVVSSHLRPSTLLSSKQVQASFTASFSKCILWTQSQYTVLGNTPTEPPIDQCQCGILLPVSTPCCCVQPNHAWFPLWNTAQESPGQTQEPYLNALSLIKTIWWTTAGRMSLQQAESNSVGFYGVVGGVLSCCFGSAGIGLPRLSSILQVGLPGVQVWSLVSVVL